MDARRTAPREPNAATVRRRAPARRHVSTESPQSRRSPRGSAPPHSSTHSFPRSRLRLARRAAAARTHISPPPLPTAAACLYAWLAQVGQLRILALRAALRGKLGDARFDTRRFHRALLEGGAVPLETMETLVRGAMLPK